MRRDPFAAVPQLFRDHLPGSMVPVAIDLGASPDGCISSRQRSVPLLSILMSQPVAGDAIVAGDAAGSHHVVVVVLPLGELSLWIASARGRHRAECFSPLEQRSLFRCPNGLDPVPST